MGLGFGLERSNLQPSMGLTSCARLFLDIFFATLNPFKIFRRFGSEFQVYASGFMSLIVTSRG